MSGPKLRVFSTGVDNVYFSCYGDLRAGVLDDLERWRAQAKDNSERLRVKLWRTGTPFLAKEHGARGYSYLLTSDDMDLMVGAAKNFPPLRVELRSAYLHSMTPGPVEILGKDFLTGDPDLQASRVDLYADVQGWPLVKADLDRFVTRARLRGLYREELVKDGRRLTGFRFGRAALMALMYDKTLELERSGKRWMRDIWGAGVDPEQPVWRLEFEFKWDLIKSFQFDGPAEVLWGLQDLWRYATVRWLTYRTPGRTRSERWPVAPIWKEVQGIEIVPQMTGLVRQREKDLSEERTLRLMQGCLTSLGALNGWSSLGDAWKQALPLVAAQFEEGDRSFVARVREKAARHIGVTVAETDSLIELRATLAELSTELRGVKLRLTLVTEAECRTGALTPRLLHTLALIASGQLPALWCADHLQLPHPDSEADAWSSLGDGVAAAVEIRRLLVKSIIEPRSLFKLTALLAKVLLRADGEDHAGDDEALHAFMARMPASDAVLGADVVRPAHIDERAAETLAMRVLATWLATLPAAQPTRVEK